MIRFFEECEAEINFWKLRFETLNEESIALKEKIIKETNEKEEIQAYCQNMVDMNKTLLEKTSLLQEENMVLLEKLRVISLKYQDLLNENSEIKIKFQNNKTNMKQEQDFQKGLEDYKDKLHKKEQIIANLKENLAELSNDKEKLLKLIKSEKNSSREDRTQNLYEREIQIKKLSEEKEIYLEKCQEKEKELQNYFQAYREKERLIERMKEEFSFKNQQIFSLKEKIETYEKEIDFLKEKQSHLKNLNFEFSLIKEENSALKEELHKSKSNFALQMEETKKFHNQKENEEFLNLQEDILEKSKIITSLKARNRSLVEKLNNKENQRNFDIENDSQDTLLKELHQRIMFLIKVGLMLDFDSFSKSNEFYLKNFKSNSQNIEFLHDYISDLQKKILDSLFYRCNISHQEKDHSFIKNKEKNPLSKSEYLEKTVNKGKPRIFSDNQY